MTRTQLFYRFALAVLFAAVLASILHRVNGVEAAPVAVAADGECDENDPNASCEALVVYSEGMCRYLTPYTYWWGFWGCENRDNELQMESVTVTEFDNGRLTEIERTHADGRIVRLTRWQRHRR